MTTLDPVWTLIERSIQEVFAAYDAAISPETVATDIDGWDSVSHSYLILHIEEKLGITFPGTRIPYLENVGELYELANSLLEKR